MNLSWRALLTSAMPILLVESASAEDGGEHAWGMSRRLGSVRLGVRVTPTTQQLREALGVGADEGALVMEVTRRGPAGRAGLRAGDVLTPVGGTPVGSTRGVTAALAATGPSRRVGLQWGRGGRQRDASAAPAPGRRRRAGRIERRPCELGTAAEPRAAVAFPSRAA